MLNNPMAKYRQRAAVALPDRAWPNQILDATPTWCSVDLRAGNHALIEPMDAQRKQRMFDMLVKIGFREIEIGFPAASRADFDFVRRLIEHRLIPDDVTVQVLTQASPELIARTFDALQGVRRAIVHLHDSNFAPGRTIAGAGDRQRVIDAASHAAQCVLEHAREQAQTDWVFEYSPENFSGIELDFVVAMCDAAVAAWQPTPQRKVILNLPATVELSTPNVFADRVEWFCKQVAHRDSTVVSIRPHNDRGTAVAAAELGILAGAERVEGTLFGNGERTGNVDLVTLALNLYTLGVDPELDLSNINQIARQAEHCNQLPIHPRHPYVGDLVFTAFSGVHQDAIGIGLAARRDDDVWEVPYLPIDPRDVGRTYESVVRINSQSGTGGISRLLERDYGITMPRRLQIEFNQVIQYVADTTGEELTSEQVWSLFEQEYLGDAGVYLYRGHELCTAHDGAEHLRLKVAYNQQGALLHGAGNGPIDAIVDALGLRFDVLSYEERSVGAGSGARAMAFVEITTPARETLFGVGMHASIVTASLQAVLSAVNRALRHGLIDDAMPVAAVTSIRTSDARRSQPGAGG